MQRTSEPEIIEKEIISSLSFNSSDKVSQHPELITQISKATKLGNTHRRKVSIVFRDDEGNKRVDTTIWAYGARCICLKGGVWIPINRILEIKF